MSYLIRGIINKDEAYSQRLADGYSWHQFLWKLFPGMDGKERPFLFRIDEKENFFQCYILSDIKTSLPDWGKWDLKEVSDAFLNRNVYKFQLKANPTKRLSIKDGKDDGKRVGIYTQDELKEWLIRKSEQSGFNAVNFSISAPISEFFNRKDMKNKLNRIDFEGVLEVTEREKFKHAFYNGIGSAKSMGFGMLIIQATS